MDHEMRNGIVEATARPDQQPGEQMTETPDSLSPPLSSPSSPLSQEDDVVPPPPALPTSGPEFWELQRAQWLGGGGASSPPSSAPPSVSGRQHQHQHHPPRPVPEPGSSRAKLESLLNVPGAEEDEQLWRSYLGGIHRNLIGGSRLRKGLKLSLVVKVLKAGWIRDGTWVAPTASTSASTSSQVRVQSPSNPTPTTGFSTPSPYNFIKSALRGATSTPPPAAQPARSPSPVQQPRLSIPGQQTQGENSTATATTTPPTSLGETQNDNGAALLEDEGCSPTTPTAKSTLPRSNWPLGLGRLANGIVAKKKSITYQARRLSDDLRRNSGGGTAGGTATTPPSTAGQSALPGGEDIHTQAVPG